MADVPPEKERKDYILYGKLPKYGKEFTGP
jgi:hypothetical protein